MHPTENAAESQSVTSSTSSGINMVSILAYASDTVEVSALFTLWLEPVEPSSHTVGFLDAFVLARSSFANSRACKEPTAQCNKHHRP